MEDRCKETLVRLGASQISIRCEWIWIQTFSNKLRFNEILYNSWFFPKSPSAYLLMAVVNMVRQSNQIIESLYSSSPSKIVLPNQFITSSFTVSLQFYLKFFSSFSVVPSKILVRSKWLNSNSITLFLSSNLPVHFQFL